MIIKNPAMTPQEVADYLKIAKNTVYELIKRGELNGYKVGKKIRVDLKDVEEYKNRAKSKNALAASAKTSPGHAKMPHRMLPSTTQGFVICGQDPILDILSKHLEMHPVSIRALRSYIGSYNGLFALYQSNVHIATTHLWDGDTGQYNVPYVKRMLPGIPSVIINLVGRTQGFYVARGNPKKITGWDDLKRRDVSLVNREKGSGSRVLLDEHLRLMEVPGSMVNGYNQEYAAHRAVASAVARGVADIGLGTEMASLSTRGVDFIPLQAEKYDLVIKKEDIDNQPFQAILEIINSSEFKLELQGMGGYDTENTGEIVAET